MLRELLDISIQGFKPFSLLGVLVLFPVVYFAYFFLLVVYRLYFHPLAHIPGPKFPAATYLAEYYFNDIKDGRLTEYLNKWHDRYGPIIRVTPDEVHVRDPDSYEKIYYQGSKYTKPLHFYIRLCGGTRGNMFCIEDNETHRQNRHVVQPLFSRKTVEGLEHVIKNRIRNLRNRIHAELAHPTTPHAVPEPGAFNMRLALRCLTLDVVSDYSWARSLDQLNSADMGNTIITAFTSMMRALWMFRQMPTKMVKAMCSMAPETVEKFDPGAAMFGRMRAEAEKYIKSIRDDKIETSHKTLFHEYLQPDAAKTMKRSLTLEEMTMEGWGVVFAGTETTAFVMEHCILGILSQPELYASLKKQLKEAFPNGSQEMTWRKLEQIPLMNGCVKEGLRMSGGVKSRLPRVVEEDNINFHGYHIPRGYQIGTASWYMHRDPSIFTDPDDFKPERWLGPDAKKMEKYYAPFSRGQRMCVGMQLGTCEIYHLIGEIIMDENLQLHQDSMHSVREIEYVDYYLTMPRPGSKSLLITA